MSETDSEPPRAGAWKANRSKGPRLGKDEARRQGNIVTLAFTLLGGKEQALDFLNRTSSELKARPIDLAMQSDLGFLRVETLIRKLGGAPARS